MTDLIMRLRDAARRVRHAEGENLLLEAADALDVLRRWYVSDDTPDFPSAEADLVALCALLFGAASGGREGG